MSWHLGGTPYDLVFMDCQMPEMDGYETTRRIRQAQSGVPNPNLPVIAMTANAMKGDREKCLRAGMNDYIAKPISPGVVADVLNRWLSDMADTFIDQEAHPEPKPHGETLNAPIASNKSESVPGPPDQDTIAFDRTAFLERLMGDEDLAKMVIAGFLEDMPKQMADLKVPIDQGDTEKAGAQAHKIKGAAANVGGVAMSAVGLEMENAGKGGDLEQLAAMMPVLEKEFERLQQAMEGE